MSATYNWSIRPGIPNRYNITVNGADDESYLTSGWAYIALFGNDITGNGSRMYPFKTPSHAFSLVDQMNCVIGAGTYRAQNIPNGYILADGDVIVDNSLFNSTGINNSWGISLISQVNQGGYNTYLSNIKTYSSISVPPNAAYSNIYQVLSGGGGIINIQGGQISISEGNTGYHTFISSIIQLGNAFNSGGYFSIFHNCDIILSIGDVVNYPSLIDYSLFSNCTIRINSGDSPTPITDKSMLLAFLESYSSGCTISAWNHCAVGDAMFNNESIGDYTLQLGSPAKNLSYIGSYVGAHSIGFPIKATTSSLTGFDLDSNINLVISDDSIILADATQDAQIDSIVIPNLVQREISKFPSYGFMADRNGQYIDSIADLSDSTISAGSTLVYPASYIVEDAAIDYNSNPYQAGERFTTVNGVTTFTTDTTGVVREILEAPQRHTIMARFSNGDSTPLDNTSNLTPENWYYVSIGDINYNSFTYSSGDVFKVISASPSTTNFTGSGVVTLAMSDETYQHYEPGIKPTTNNVGDIRSGDILRGNGDPNYVRGQLNTVEFPINAKYIQIRYMIKVNNLKP